MKCLIRLQLRVIILTLGYAEFTNAFSFRELFSRKFTKPLKNILNASGAIIGAETGDSCISSYHFESKRGKEEDDYTFHCRPTIDKSKRESNENSNDKSNEKSNDK